MDMKEFERFNNVMDASIDKVVTDHLNKLSDIEYCVTTIQNIIANGGNTEILLTRATECVRTIKDEIEYFNSIDNIITSNLKELEEVKGRNRQLKEVNQNTLDTFKKITKEKDNKIKELNEKICRLTSENDTLSKNNIKYNDLFNLKDEKIGELNNKIDELNIEIDKKNIEIESLKAKVNSNNTYEELKETISKIEISVKDKKELKEMSKALSNIKTMLAGGYNENCLIEQINSLEDYGLIGRVDRIVRKLNDVNTSIKDNSLDTNNDSLIEERINKLDKTIEMIEENSKTLVVSNRAKKHKDVLSVNMHGETHPRFDNSIDKNELISDYKSGMTLKELSEKYGLSAPGIRNRLMFYGVYEKKYNTKK